MAWSSWGEELSAQDFLGSLKAENRGAAWHSSQIGIRQVVQCESRWVTVLARSQSIRRLPVLGQLKLGKLVGCVLLWFFLTRRKMHYNISEGAASRGIQPDQEWVTMC